MHIYSKLTDLVPKIKATNWSDRESSEVFLVESEIIIAVQEIKRDHFPDESYRDYGFDLNRSLWEVDVDSLDVEELYFYCLAIVRSDRFCEGNLYGALRNGLITDVLERLDMEADIQRVCYNGGHELEELVSKGMSVEEYVNSAREYGMREEDIQDYVKHHEDALRKGLYMPLGIFMRNLNVGPGEYFNVEEGD